MLTVLIIISIRKLLQRTKKKIQSRLLLKVICRCLAYAIIVFLLIFFLLQTSFAQSSTLHYDIVKKRSIIGSVQTIRSISDDEIRYQIHFKASVSFLIFNYNIKASQESVFKNGEMQLGSLIRTVNGKKKAQHYIALQENSYEIIKDGKPSFNLHSAINYSVSELYFSEPLDRPLIFSENHLQFIPIKQVSPHRYRITLPDGNINTYTYEDGVCILAEIETDIAQIELHLKNRSYNHASSE